MKESVLVGLVIVVLLNLGVWVAFSPYGWTVPEQAVTLFHRMVVALFVSILGSISTAIMFYYVGKEADER